MNAVEPLTPQQRQALAVAVEPLTSEERHALAIAAQGYTDTIAARYYGTCARTFRRRLASAQEKLGARSRMHAVAIAATARIIAVSVPDRRTPSGGK